MGDNGSTLEARGPMPETVILAARIRAAYMKAMKMRR